MWQQRCHFDFANVALPSNKTWQELYRELSVPLEEDSQFHRCNYGYLGEHSAVQKLHGQPAGTFLFRSSSIDASAITVSVCCCHTFQRFHLWCLAELFNIVGCIAMLRGVAVTRFNFPVTIKRTLRWTSFTKTIIRCYATIVIGSKSLLLPFTTRVVIFGTM